MAVFGMKENRRGYHKITTLPLEFAMTPMST